MISQAMLPLLTLRLLMACFVMGLILTSHDIYLLDVAVLALQLWRYLLQVGPWIISDLLTTVLLGAVVVLPLWILDRLVMRYLC